MRQYQRVVIIALALALAGCQSFWSKALPVITDIIVKVMDAEQQLDAIEKGINAYLLEHPSPEVEAQLRQQLEEVRMALRIALSTAEGVQATGEGDAQRAFDSYRRAYEQMISLLTRIGVLDSRGMMVTGPYRGKVVEPPLAIGKGVP